MVDSNPLKNVDNVDFMNAVRQDLSASYQERIPAVTKGSIAKTMDTLMSLEAQRNEFVDALVNRIGTQIARSMSWSNPLAFLKQGMLSYGSSVEEFYMGLLKAQSYSSDRDYMEKSIFGQNVPQSKSIFHKINRMNVYTNTINETMLRRAFLEGNGVSSLISNMMSIPSTSDNQDEFLAMTNLIPEYEHRGGFYHVHVPDVAGDGSDEQDAKVALRKMRAFGLKMRFISNKYNAAKMPTFLRPEDLILITSPEYQAAVDVQALAAAFNIDYAAFNARTIIIPQERFGIDGAQAILCDKSLFRIWDTKLQSTNIWNPRGLYWNYFLHHHQILSVSTFSPAVLFTTGSDSPDEAIVVYVPSSIALALAAVNGTVPTSLNAGAIYEIDPTVKDSTNTDITDKVGVVWGITGNKSNRTYITPEGVIHVGIDETAASITVSATAHYIDPSAPHTIGPNVTANETVVTGTQQWPIIGVLAGINIDGNPVANVAPGTTTYSYVGTMPTKTSEIAVDTWGSADVKITLGTNKITIVVNGGSAPVTYTVNVSAS